MSNSVEQDGQVEEPEGDASCCDAACACNARGLSTKVRVAVCLLVVLAAVAVVSLGSANKARTATKTDPFATASAAAAPIAAPATNAPAAATAAKPAPTTTDLSGSLGTAAPTPAPATGKPAAPAATKAEPTAVWGPALSSLASLNQLAVDKDAVFVFLPAKDGKQTETIRAQVEAAVRKSQSRGSAIAAYTLSSDAKEYAQVTSQVSAPCVLAMVKGAGAIPVSGEITEVKLLEALVTASRPSSCGPSGCGPSSPGCG